MISGFKIKVEWRCSSVIGACLPKSGGEGGRGEDGGRERKRENERLTRVLGVNIEYLR